MPVLRTQDRGEREIAAQLSPSVMEKISRDVRSELNQLVIKNIDFEKTNYATDAEEATRLFHQYIVIIEKELCNWAQGYSSMRWLWMLRRLPLHIFSGRLNSTLGYDRTLAEVLSARSNKASSALQNSASQIHYDVSGSVPKRLARFCEGTRYLSQIHSYLRWAGKGSSFHFFKDRFPERIVDKDLEKAVSLYDQRLENGDMPFSRGGTKLFERLTSLSTDLAILRINQINPQNINIPNDLMQALGAGYSSQDQWTLHTRFMPDFISVAPFKEL